MSVSDLSHLTTSIPWLRYFDIVLDRTLDGTEDIVVYASDYFPQLGALLDKTEPRLKSLKENNYLP